MDPRGKSSSTDDTVVPEPTRARPASAGAWAMAFVEGSSPQLSGETDDLLRRRLRAASLLFFAGFLAFFVRRLLILDWHETTVDWIVFWSHLAITIITGLVGLRLCTNCPFILRNLRVFELVVFGGSAIFLVLLSDSILLYGARQGYVIPIVHIWLMLIFTYTLFIPNTIRRVSAVVGAMAAAPVLLMIGVALTSEDFANLLRTNPDFGGCLIETFMTMSLAAATAIWGASTMGTLRREAFAARQLGQYRLKHQIGEGGMGEVYLAEHLLLKRPSAIKLIRPDKAGDTTVLARFEREVMATAKLTHWNTIEIYDYGRAEDGTFYYVMEYLPGMNLGQLVELCGPLPAARAIHLLMQTCEALSEAHDQGLLHRDIKPANIFAAHRGGVYDVAKLLDFGLAKPIANLTDTSITLEGTITGSPLYMSPEQITGEAIIDARADIYSLGAVAYFLLTGVPPFSSNQPVKVMLAHARDEPVPLTQHNSEIPADLEQVVLRCLEKDPEDRFQDAERLRDALAECEASGDWSRADAADWWHHHGCPKKKALDASVLQAVEP